MKYADQLVAVEGTARPVTGELQLAEQSVVKRFLEEPDEESFGPLFRTFCPRVLCYFEARGCDASLAADLTQEVMLTVYRHAGALRDRSLFRAWMFQIAHRVLLRQWHKAGRQGEAVDLEQLDDRRSARRPSFGGELADAMRCLLPQERQVILLKFVDQLEYREIAAVLELPVGTVKWRVFCSKKKLAGYFGKGRDNRE